MTYSIKASVFGKFYKFLIFKDENEMLEFETKNDIYFGVEDCVLDDISKIIKPTTALRLKLEPPSPFCKP